MKEELTMSQIGLKKHLKTATEAGSAEVPGYVRCELCDCAFREDSGVELEKLEVKTNISRFNRAWFDCPACGHKNLSYIFPST
jgi:rubredoxin